MEQLKVHSRTLGIPVFEKGYQKDPAAVAKAACDAARKEKKDVVLVDTAGRMQNNLPLMQVRVNMLFIGVNRLFMDTAGRMQNNLPLMQVNRL